MIRGASGRAACIVLAALALPSCRAYDARLWSFPLNSMEMVDDAVSSSNRTFARALGYELLMQCFPWSWIVSAVDILMLPITIPYDLVELAIAREDPYPFEQQVQDRRRQGVHKPPGTPDRMTEAGPKVRPDRGAQHLEPAEH